MGIVGNCSPFYVRCIKPNTVQQPSTFDNTLVVEQLKYLGMIETIKVTPSGQYINQLLFIYYLFKLIKFFKFSFFRFEEWDLLLGLLLKNLLTDTVVSYLQQILALRKKIFRVIVM